MAADKNRAMTQLNDITECCICRTTFTDPRMLPCIHTFCFQCLKDLAEKSNKKPGDQIQCPVCRKEFAIPSNGVQGVQKNFFMTTLIEVSNALDQSKMDLLPCDACKANNYATEAHIPDATMRCVDCQENLCELCFKMHKTLKMSKNHKILSIGRGIEEEETVKSLKLLNCDVHSGKVLDYYCADCKKVMCVSCFVESHKTHNCKDVNTVDEEFRKSIESNAHIMMMLAEELQAKRKKLESKEDYLQKTDVKKGEILQRNKDLKEVIDEHTKSLLSSLDDMKNRHLKEIQMEEEELDRRLTVLESFSRYCEELKLKGSASEVCRCKDELLRRADELEEDHETYIMLPQVSFDVTFIATDLDNFCKTVNGNIVGSVNDNVEQLEDIVIGGLSDTSKRILSRHSETLSRVRYWEMCTSKCAAVYNNSMYVTGIGETFSEIWKYNFAAGWNKCGSLVRGREGHCVTFIGDTLYICGGNENNVVLESIEAYSALTTKSTEVGRFIFGSEFAACVAFEGSVYIFGGFDKDGDELDCVQVYSSVDRTCTLLSTTLPRPCNYLRALLWETYALLLGSNMCFILDLNENTWLERQQFATDKFSPDIFLSNGRLFVFETVDMEADGHGNSANNCKDNVKYVKVSSIVNNEAAKWKTLSHLPKSFSFIEAASTLQKSNIVQARAVEDRVREEKKLLKSNMDRARAGKDRVREKKCKVS